MNRHFSYQGSLISLVIKGIGLRILNIHDKVHIPSRKKFVEVLEQHEWGYHTSEDPLVKERGEKSLRMIQYICVVGGNDYHDMYDEYINYIMFGCSKPKWSTL